MPQLDITDETLWNSFRSGDESAFEVMYKRHFRELYSYGYHLARNKTLVEDCIHDLFVYLHDHRATLGTTTSIKFYLYRSLRRLVATKLEAAQKLVSSSEQPEAFEFEIIPPHEAALIEDDAHHEQRRRLQTLINELPKRQKEALYLAYYEDFSHKHIAEVMGIEVETVYNFLYRALAALKANQERLLSVVVLLKFFSFFIFFAALSAM